MDGFSNDIPIDPVDELSSVDNVNADFVINGTRTEIDLAKDAADNIEADIAIPIAGCFVEAMECNTQCQQCVSGVIQRQLQDVDDQTGKIINAINRGISNELSDGFAAALNLGVPATDLIPGATSTDGVDLSNITQGIDSGTTINAVICPTGSLPEVSGNDTVVCVTPDLTPVEPVAVVTDDGQVIPVTTPSTGPITLPAKPTEPFPGGVTTVGVQVAPTPIPVHPIPPSQPPVQPVQPTTPINNPGSTTGDCISLRLINTWIPIDQWIAQTAFAPGDLEQMLSTINNFRPPGTNGTIYVDTARSSPTSVHWLDGSNCAENSTGPINPNPAGPPPQPPPTQPPPVVTTVDPQIGVNVCNPLVVADTVSAMESFRVSTDFIAAAGLGGALTASLSGLISAFKDPKGFADPSLISNSITALAGFLATNVTYRMAKQDISGSLGTACDNEAVRDSQLSLGFFKFIGTLPGLVPEYVKQTATYQANYLCPYLLPTALEANILWNQGIIDDDQWNFVVRCNAICPEWAKLSRTASQQLLTPDQLAIALRRDIIDDETYDKLIRRNGLVDEDVKLATFKLTEFIPGPSDLVRFMVRDAFDEQVATDLQLDKDFIEKFSGKAREWAKAQGMSEDQFKFFWRSHWQIPSYTQLTEALHRLTEDTPLPGGQGTAKAVTVEQVRRAIEINDMAPEWVDRLIAISYRPLSRVDARRAFEIEAITEKELRKSYTDLGYSPGDADKLVEFSVEQAAPKQAKAKGNASTAEVLKWYEQQLIPKDQAYELLFRSGIRKDRLDAYLDTADLRRTANNRKVAMAALKKRWMTGEFNVGEATDQLNRIGIPPESIGELLFQWSIIRDSKYKAPTVSMLCDWWGHGLITIDEFNRRVENLGYSHVDANRIVQTCQGKRAELLAKEAEKMEKEAEAKERRRLADIRRQQREQRTMEKEIAAAIKAAAPCTPPKKPVCGTNGSGKQ